VTRADLRVLVAAALVDGRGLDTSDVLDREAAPAMRQREFLRALRRADELLALADADALAAAEARRLDRLLPEERAREGRP
jgi:hypothetical protein